MNSADAPCFFPPCGSYEVPPQPPGAQWGWPRQDMAPGYPYYADSSTAGGLQGPLPHQTLGAIPPPDSSTTVVSPGGGGCPATSSDCRVGGSGGFSTPNAETSGRRSVKEEQNPEPHSNERDEDLSGPHSSMKQEATSSDNGKKKRDRFNGMTEEEVLKKTVPDLLAPSLDIIIIGSCPGLTAAYLGHHYAGPGNHFWKCLYLSGLIPEPMNACDDFKLKQYGIGFTNFIARCSKGSVEFSRSVNSREIKEGIETLTEKIQTYKPKIAVFNGKGIYEVFCNHKNFYIGKQPEPFPGTNTVVYVMPSSSARCSQLPRASDKVPFFVALRKLRDHLCGCLPHLDESEVVFPDLDLKVEPRKDRRPTEESGRSSGTTGGSAVVSESAGSATGSTETKDRKRRSVDCNYNEMALANERLYRPGGLASSFTAAMSSDMSQDFKWGAAGFQKWPAPPGFGGFGSHPFAGPGAAVGCPPGSSRSGDCTYEAMLAAKQQEERLNQLRSFSTGHTAGAWPYSGWPDAAAFQHRLTMHGLANRFGNDPMSSRYAIPPYLQYPDMISTAGDRLSGHHLADGRAGAAPTAPMYPSFYNPGSFQPGEAAAAAAAASAFSYNPALAHHDMKAATQLDPTGFLPRPSYTPPSYYPQYR